MEIEVFIILCMETDNMEKEGSLSMEIEGTPFPGVKIAKNRQ